MNIKNPFGAFPLKSPPTGGHELLRISFPAFYFLMTGTVVPARSLITLTKSLSAGTMILVLSFKASATVSSFLSSCALPIKYSSAATLTVLMASPSASAFNRIAAAIPSAFLISARLSPFSSGPAGHQSLPTTPSPCFGDS